eukprot:1193411-Prorocentrum_minimum.AAC.4
MIPCRGGLAGRGQVPQMWAGVLRSHRNRHREQVQRPPGAVGSSSGRVGAVGPRRVPRAAQQLVEGDGRGHGPALKKTVPRLSFDKVIQLLSRVVLPDVLQELDGRLCIY